jgi:hypothetical protein
MGKYSLFHIEFCQSYFFCLLICLNYYWKLMLKFINCLVNYSAVLLLGVVSLLAGSNTAVPTSPGYGGYQTAVPPPYYTIYELVTTATTSCDRRPPSATPLRHRSFIPRLTLPRATTPTPRNINTLPRLFSQIFRAKQCNMRVPSKWRMWGLQFWEHAGHLFTSRTCHRSPNSLDNKVLYAHHLPNVVSHLFDTGSDTGRRTRRLLQPRKAKRIDQGNWFHLFYISRVAVQTFLFCFFADAI